MTIHERAVRMRGQSPSVRPWSAEGIRPHLWSEPLHLIKRVHQIKPASSWLHR